MIHLRQLISVILKHTEIHRVREEKVKEECKEDASS